MHTLAPQASHTFPFGVLVRRSPNPKYVFLQGLRSRDLLTATLLTLLIHNPLEANEIYAGALSQYMYGAGKQVRHYN